jgi:predicted DsbA family dithiol-disulfide isomerase
LIQLFGNKIKNKINNMVKNKKTKKQKKDYFEIIFILISILLFLLLLISIYWFRSSLFNAKDQVALEFLDNQEKNSISSLEDPFVSTKTYKLEEAGPSIQLSDPILGNPEAKIKIFYWSDFACSFCFDQENILKKVYSKFKDNVIIIRKDYPDTNSVESFSFQASRAARCANNQGKFWDYNELLYKNKDQFTELSDQLFIDLAQVIKLNLEDFKACLQNNEVDQDIFNNIEEAEDLGVIGIPYIYINDKDFLGDINEEELGALIESKLENN